MSDHVVKVHGRFGISGSMQKVREEESRDRQPLVSRCVFCEWTYLGRAAEGREKALQHRTEAHPEAPAHSKIRRSRRSSGQMKDWEREEMEANRRKRAFLIGIDVVE